MGDWIARIIFAACIIGLAAGLFSYGKWIMRQETAVGFWSNVPFDASRIRDAAAYNREYGKLFQKFSIAPAIAGVAMLISLDIPAFVILMLWATVGVAWLIRSYKALEKNHFSR